MLVAYEIRNAVHGVTISKTEYWICDC